MITSQFESVLIFTFNKFYFQIEPVFYHGFYIHKYVDIIALTIFSVFANKYLITFRINQEFYNIPENCTHCDLDLETFFIVLFDKIRLNTNISML